MAVMSPTDRSSLTLPYLTVIPRRNTAQRQVAGCGVSDDIQTFNTYFNGDSTCIRASRLTDSDRERTTRSASEDDGRRAASKQKRSKNSLLNYAQVDRASGTPRSRLTGSPPPLSPLLTILWARTLAVC